MDKTARVRRDRIAPDTAAAIICWTPRGEARGGTGLGIKVAARSGVPVFNLHDLPRGVVLEEMTEIARARTEGREPDLRVGGRETGRRWTDAPHDDGRDVLRGEECLAADRRADPPPRRRYRPPSRRGTCR